MNLIKRSSKTFDSSAPLKSGKAHIEVAAITKGTEAPLIFHAELMPSALKHSFRDQLLLPFFQQVHKGTPVDKGDKLACTAIEVNGQPLLSAEELARPLRDWATPGDTTRVAITIESVEMIRKRRRSLYEKKTKAELPVEYVPHSHVPTPGAAIGALDEEPSGLLLILDEIAPSTR